MSHRTRELVQRSSELVYRRAVFGIAHAIGTPLNVISGHAELLMSRPASESEVGLQKIVAECRSITNLLAGPLEAAPSESRGQSVELDSLLGDVHELVSDDARARGQIELGSAAKLAVPAIDSILALYALSEIGARLSSGSFVVRAEPDQESVALTLVCQTESESPKTARELAEPWRPGANRAIGQLGILCHALAAVRGGRPRLERQGASLEFRLEIPLR